MRYLFHCSVLSIFIILSFLSCKESTQPDQVTEWMVYDTTNSEIPFNYVWTLTIDKNDMKWMGTHSTNYGPGRGLVGFDGTEWITYNTDNSDLPNNQLFSLISDRDGNLWVGAIGLCKFDVRIRF